MSDDDMIRRGDVIAALKAATLPFGYRQAVHAITNVTAVQVAVKPMTWFEVEKSRHGGKYTADGYTIRYIEGLWIIDFAGNSKTDWRFPTIEAAKAAAQADYEARIRSALTAVPSPDVVGLEAAVNELLQIRAVWADPHNDEICGKVRAALARVKGGAA